MALGFAEGNVEGRKLGSILGSALGSVLGSAVGSVLGNDVGDALLVGLDDLVGSFVGSAVGFLDGFPVGSLVGSGLGEIGPLVESCEAEVGSCVGLEVDGPLVGLSVCCIDKKDAWVGDELGR